MEESNPELELFRQKWKEEVSARTKAENSKESNAGSLTFSPRPQPAPRLGTDRIVNQSEDGDEIIELRAALGYAGASGAQADEYGDGLSAGKGLKEPRSAIEHYEKAVERESQGSLGDSLDHYRKAFRVGCRPLNHDAKLIERSWIIKSTKNTETNTFQPPIFQRNI
jgi:F-box protein 9